MNQEISISILVVDDEQEIIESFKRLFRKLPYAFFFADSGEQALQILADNDIDIVISDMRMPQMTGAELFSHITLHAPTIYKILVTGFADLSMTIDAINEGAINKYVQKPWKNEALLKVVQEGVQHVIEAREISSLQLHADKQNTLLKDLSDNLQLKIDIRTEQVKTLLETAAKEQKSIYQLLYSVIEVHPVVDEHFAKAACQLAGFLSQKLALPEEQIRHVKLATLLCEIGAIGLETELLKIPVQQLTADQKSRFQDQLEKAKTLLLDFENLSIERELILRQYNCQDDEKNKPGVSSDISLSILCCARDLCRYVNGRMSGTPMDISDAIAMTAKRQGIDIHPDVIDALTTHGQEISELFSKAELPCLISVHDAEPGMILSSSIYTKQQHLLLKKGIVLTPELIAKLQELDIQDFQFISVFIAPHEKSTEK